MSMRTPVSTPKLEVLDALIAADDFNPFSLESGAPQQRNEPGNSHVQHGPRVSPWCLFVFVIEAFRFVDSRELGWF